jgi:hypothetical protein
VTFAATIPKRRNEHAMSDVDDLKRARRRLVSDRRLLAQVLAGPCEPGKLEEARAAFIKIQAAIEAVDHAIDDGMVGFEVNSHQLGKLAGVGKAERKDRVEAMHDWRASAGSVLLGFYSVTRCVPRAGLHWL